MTIMALVFAAVLPQFRVIQNSWSSKQAAAETLQNSRVLMDHLNYNLSKAAMITAVSGPSEINGYIEFMDNDESNLRYDIDSISNYVEFGPVGSLYDLAGPVSQLLFTCYDGNDFDVPITDVNSIRFIKVQTILTNPATMGQDKTFTTYAYLRASGSGQAEFSKGTPFEYSTIKGKKPALAKIDNNHYLCAYQDDLLDDGWAVVLTVDTGTWTITKQTPYEYDNNIGKAPALAQIDTSHYLCANQGYGDDGWAMVLTVDTGTWQITREPMFEFNASEGRDPALAKIDNNHYLCAYRGRYRDGWAVVLTVNAGDWTISKETAYEYDTSNGETPALAQIDSTHYLCAYEGNWDDGWVVVLTVDTGTWQITKETPFEFDTLRGKTPALAQIDPDNYLCAYTGDGDDGWAVVLTVDTGTWQITKGTLFEFDTLKGKTPALAQIDPDNYLCAYAGDGDDGWAVMLMVDTGTGQIANGTPFEFDTLMGKTPALAQVDPNNYLCAYAGDGDDGWSVVLKPGAGPGIQP